MILRFLLLMPVLMIFITPDINSSPLQAQAFSHGSLFLEKLTTSEMDAFLKGEDPKTVILQDGRTLEEFLGSLPILEVYRDTVGAGGTCSGSTLQLRGSVSTSGNGGSLLGDSFELRAGYWGESDILFIDGFESGDTSFWTGG